VELFHSIGVALAPLQRSGGAIPSREHFESVGVVPFAAPKTNGTLMLSMNDEVYGLLAPPVLTASAKNDALRELTNQLIGRIKNRLMQFQAILRVGLPSTTRKELLKQRPSATASTCYRFRTLRGEIVVTLASEYTNEESPCS
jgi:hypothetical protein